MGAATFSAPLGRQARASAYRGCSDKAQQGPAAGVVKLRDQIPRFAQVTSSALPSAACAFAPVTDGRPVVDKPAKPDPAEDEDLAFAVAFGAARLVL
jgi:hypothetical protein